MSQRQDGRDEDDIEQLLTHGVASSQETSTTSTTNSRAGALQGEDEEEALDVPLQRDVHGALGLFAEGSQDMATATVELSLGRHFACVDFCNQAVEKATQAVSLLRFGRRTAYDHNLRTLGMAVGAPPNILDELERLTPFHPETFYMDTPPEEADDVINAEQASSYIQSARTVMRWARTIVLNP